MHSEGACDEAAYDTAQNARGDRGGRMMLANFALNGSALADTGRANTQSDVTRDRVPAILEHHRAGMSGDLWA